MLAPNGLAEEVVSCEPVSPPHFPANREKYREFVRIDLFSATRHANCARQLGVSGVNSLRQRTGNFVTPNRDCLRGIREE